MDIDDAWGLGYTGSGQTIAILDTGVDNDHAFLGGRVVSEACYSTTNSIATSVCPGGASSSTAAESGENCSLTISGCDHGTHVAGIAAGNGASFDGVARDANIIAIQVFSRFTGECAGFDLPSPCALTYPTDQLYGLQRVYALRNTYDIASANMSLGGGANSTACDSDLRKTAIDNLASANIATVISSGNNYYDGSIGAPACISTAIAVGSTTDANAVSSFSNHATLIDLMAVGSSVNSSVPPLPLGPPVPGGGFSVFNGTSMAAPHVAGAWALLKQAGESAVTDVEHCFKSTGVGVTRAGITKPRIDADNAINSYLAGTCGSGPPCDTRYYSSNPVTQAGFGQPYDVFAPSDLLMDAGCANTTARLDVGKGDPLQYIYRYGYEWRNGRWESIEFTGDNLIVNLWWVGDASVDRPWTATEQGQTNNFYAAYVCTWRTGQWKCGCRDATCAQRYWQLQSFRSPAMGGGSAVAVAAPSRLATPR